MITKIFWLQDIEGYKADLFHHAEDPIYFSFTTLLINGSQMFSLTFTSYYFLPDKWSIKQEQILSEVI